VLFGPGIWLLISKEGYTENGKDNDVEIVAVSGERDNSGTG